VTVYRRGNIFWSYFYVDGVRHQSSTGTGNRRQAEAIDQKLKHEANLRRHQIDVILFNPNMTFGELAARFIANAGPKPFHLDRLNHLLPYFADIPLVRITKGLVREYRAERLARRTITDATLNRDAAVLRHILYWAVDEGLLITNPLARLRLPHERRVKRSVLSLADEQKLVGQAPKHLKPMILAALYAGLRRGEVLNQRWEDIDFDRNLLAVTRSKTPQGESREIPLAGCLLESLLPLRQPMGLVFTYKSRGITDYKTAWNHAVKTSLARHFLFHELRHTFNTRLMEAGVIQDVRRALMGHSPGKDVNSIYTHVELPVKREAIRKLEAWITLQRTTPRARTGENHHDGEPERMHPRAVHSDGPHGLSAAGGERGEETQGRGRVPPE
jgi:integrase